MFISIFMCWVMYCCTYAMIISHKMPCLCCFRKWLNSFEVIWAIMMARIHHKLSRRIKLVALLQRYCWMSKRSRHCLTFCCAHCAYTWHCVSIGVIAAYLLWLYASVDLLYDTMSNNAYLTCIIVFIVHTVDLIEKQCSDAGTFSYHTCCRQITLWYKDISFQQ